MIPGVVAGQMRNAGPSMTLAALISSLGPAQWFRLDDNAANSTVVDAINTGSPATLYSAVNGSSLATKNTSTVSTAGLVSGDSNKAFAFGGNSLIAAPNIALSNATGWTVFCIARIDSVPALGNSALLQLTARGSSCPELDVYDVDGAKFRFRAMLSGSSEITMNATPQYSYGTRIAVAFRKRAGGAVDIFCNGSLVASSTSTPSFAYGSEGNNYGAARFGPNTNYYSIPGPTDEFTLWQTPLSDVNCVALTSYS